MLVALAHRLVAVAGGQARVSVVSVLESLGVDVVGDGADAVWVLLRVVLEVARGVAADVAGVTAIPPACGASMGISARSGNSESVSPPSTFMYS